MAAFQVELAPRRSFINLFIAPALIFLFTTDAYDPSLGMSQECKDLCDSQRSGGWRGEFSFDCADVHLIFKERALCKSQCSKCPKSVCDPSVGSSKYLCPSTDLGRTCKERCDSRRKRGIADGYILECDKAHSTTQDISKCQQDCSSCPNWVCNPANDTNHFNCPTGSNGSVTCGQTCEQYRATKGGKSPKPYQFNCSSLTGTDNLKCNQACAACSSFICRRFINNGSYAYEFNCPSELPTPLPTTTTEKPAPKYEGKCQERCDKFRLGGLEEYHFTCEELFLNPAEQMECILDCTHCPRETCDASNAENGTVFHCPRSANFSTPEEKRGNEMTTTALVALGGAVVMTLLCIVSTVFCFIYWKKAKHGGTAVGPEESGTGPKHLKPKTNAQSKVGFHLPKHAPSRTSPSPSHTPVKSDSKPSDTKDHGPSGPPAPSHGPKEPSETKGPTSLVPPSPQAPNQPVPPSQTPAKPDPPVQATSPSVPPPHPQSFSTPSPQLPNPTNPIPPSAPLIERPSTVTASANAPHNSDITTTTNPTEVTSPPVPKQQHHEHHKKGTKGATGHNLEANDSSEHHGGESHSKENHEHEHHHHEHHKKGKTEGAEHHHKKGHKRK